MGIAAILLTIAKLNPEILKLLREGKRLEAIKKYRLEMSEVYGRDVGLLAAKLYVDKLASDYHIPTPLPFWCGLPNTPPTKPQPRDDEEGSIWDGI